MQPFLLKFANVNLSDLKKLILLPALFLTVLLFCIENTFAQSITLSGNATDFITPKIIIVAAGLSTLAYYYNKCNYHHFNNFTSGIVTAQKSYLFKSSLFKI